MALSIKPELCQYTGFKIHPGHGKKYVRVNSQTFILITKKAERQFKEKKNPRKIAWTSVYRQLHRKGIQEETKRRRVKKQKKIIRSVVGLSVEDIKRKRKPEQHAALRDAAIRARKEKVKGNKNKGNKGGKGGKRAKQPKQPKQKGSNKGGR
eukprot:TRINITY_DN46705_c0_g1_i1.p2 TRINITY_DN46705_c0_g1~~TRINITY_DN46705_c0_g1_i1.p2  ORF type:complete len:152 (-),score=51.27 TRINITY_DN46705_c0_g1_i1:238-693(-)